jgi:cytochrome c-type biogenesis protein CcmE
LLIISGLKDNTGSYLTIKEATSIQKKSNGKYIQMEGTLVNGSTKWDPENVILNFTLQDGKNKINV